MCLFVLPQGEVTSERDRARTHAREDWAHGRGNKNVHADACLRKVPHALRLRSLRRKTEICWMLSHADPADCLFPRCLPGRILLPRHLLVDRVGHGQVQENAETLISPRHGYLATLVVKGCRLVFNTSQSHHRGNANSRPNSRACKRWGCGWPFECSSSGPFGNALGFCLWLSSLARRFGFSYFLLALREGLLKVLNGCLREIRRISARSSRFRDPVAWPRDW